MRVGIVYKPDIENIESITKQVTDKLIKHGVDSVWWTPSGKKPFHNADNVPNTSIIISIGGDGTVLKAAQLSYPWYIPIVAVNAGNLGFLTEISIDSVLEELPKFMDGRHWIDERTMLEVALIKDGKLRSMSYALNDAVISHGSMSQTIYTKTKVDGAYLTTYKSDGVIVSTATGSTGYNLSVGGPILNAESKEMIICPIASHLTFNRPLVVPQYSHIEFEVETDNSVILNVDGKQHETKLMRGDVVKVSRSVHSVVFLRIQDKNYFYQTLMQRLQLRA